LIGEYINAKRAFYDRIGKTNQVVISDMQTFFIDDI